MLNPNSCKNNKISLSIIVRCLYNRITFSICFDLMHYIRFYGFFLFLKAFKSINLKNKVSYYIFTNFLIFILF